VSAQPDAVFLPGERPGEFTPTELSRGPWSADAQHGGAPGALLARCIERHAGPEHRLARLTVEFLKPVPLTPLSVSVEGRPGRSAGRWQAALTSGDALVATAQAVTVVAPDEPLTVPELGQEDPPPVAYSEGLPVFRIPGMPDYRSFYGTAMDPRVAAGAGNEPGEATGWFILTCPLVAGEPTSPSALAVAAADFGNGLSWVLPLDEYAFSNADLTVNLWRAPVGDRVGLAARTIVAPNGTGVATGQLFDDTGMLGSSGQTLVVRGH
jgi:acyl-coenzyme A thioesterase PaaI-like protein